MNVNNTILYVVFQSPLNARNNYYFISNAVETNQCLEFDERLEDLIKKMRVKKTTLNEMILNVSKLKFNKMNKLKKVSNLIVIY